MVEELGNFWLRSFDAKLCRQLERLDDPNIEKCELNLANLKSTILKNGSGRININAYIIECPSLNAGFWISMIRRTLKPCEGWLVSERDIVSGLKFAVRFRVVFRELGRCSFVVRCLLLEISFYTALQLRRIELEKS